MRKFNPTIPSGDWKVDLPFLNRILGLLFSRTLPKVGSNLTAISNNVVALNSDLKIVSDEVAGMSSDFRMALDSDEKVCSDNVSGLSNDINVIDGGDSDHPV